MREARSPRSALIIVANPYLAPVELDLLRKLAANGSRIIAWQHPSIVQERFPSLDVAAALRAAGVESTPLAKALGERTNIAVDEAVIAWMKAFGRTPLSESGNFRSLFRYRRLSLWWWAELFLYHDTPLRLFVRDIEAMAQIMEKERPDRLILMGSIRDLDRVALKLAPSVERHGTKLRFPAHSSRASIRFLAALLKTLGTGIKSIFRRAPRHTQSGRPRILFLTHASMWRKKSRDEAEPAELEEMYLGQILKALDSAGEETQIVAVGPTVPFKQRGLRAILSDVLELADRRRPFVAIRRYFSLALSLEVARASLQCWNMWREFLRLPRLEDALEHRGVPLPKEALASFRDAFLLQLPWAIRSYREIEAVLLQEKPSLMVLYAEYSGLGRAAVAAAHEKGVPSFAVQHGILYPRFYANEHAKDEVGTRLDGTEAVPIPSRTAVFGSLARDLLVERGNYPLERIVITGSPKFDTLVAASQRFSREKTRRRLNLDLDATVLVVASRFIAIGPVFAELVRAAEQIDNLWLVVKPHQAERADLYQQVGASEKASRLRILSLEENLLELLFASDGLITVDSFASSEALVLGRPVMVVNLPSNLSPLVERGLALGVLSGEPIEPALRRFLSDRDLGRNLEQQRQKYLEEFAYGADGASTDRTVSAIRETAGRGVVEPSADAQAQSRRSISRGGGTSSP